MILNDIYFFFSWRFELALQQNATLDVFTNDYMELGEEESAFGAKSDNHLKVFINFIVYLRMIWPQ